MTGTIYRCYPGESLKEIKWDWKALYYDAMLAIAESRDGTNPEPLKHALAAHHTRMRMIAVTSSAVDGDHG